MIDSGISGIFAIYPRQAHTHPVRHVEKKWFHTFLDKATNVFCFGTLGMLTLETDWIQGAQT